MVYFVKLLKCFLKPVCTEKPFNLQYVNIKLNANFFSS